MSTTVKAVTARKQHRCDTVWGEVHLIQPRHRYLRHVAFPDDDVNGSDRPWVLRECVACVEEREGCAMFTAGACSMFCHGTTPCALPFKHNGDHSCLRCAVEAARAAATREEVTV